MTGRDVPTREKALSVAFSVIMVLSMVAIGGAAFAGSAAGQTLSETPDDINATITSNPADFGVDANDGSLDHVVLIEVDNNLAGTDLSTGKDIVLDYSSDYTIGGSLTIDDADVEPQVIRGGSVTDADLFAGTGGGATVQDGSNNVTITTDDGGPKLQEGDYIRIAIDYNGAAGGADQFAHPSEGSNTDVTVDVDGGSQVEDISLNLGNNAPIEVSDTGSGSANYSSLTEAVSAIGNDGEQITIRSNASELESQPAAVGSIAGVDVDANGGDFTITSESDLATVSVPDLTETEYIDLTEDNNITVDTVGFAVDDRYSDGTAVDSAILEGTGTGNLTITNSEFDGFNGAAIDVVLDQGVDADDTTSEISGNVFTNVDEAIAVDASSEVDDGDSVTISDNNVQSFGGTNAFELVALASGVDLTFESNDVDGGGTGTNAITVTSTSENVTITDGTVNDVATGANIQDAYSGTNGVVTVSGTVFTNISSNAVNVGGVSGNGDSVAIQNIEVDDSSDNPGTGISIGARADFEVTGATINDTGTGISVGSSDALGVISDTTITNTVNTGIDLDDPTNTDTKIAINESTSIDQADIGVVIAHDSNNVLDVDVDNVVINGTDSGAVNVTNMQGQSDGNNVFNITNSEFTNNNAGFGLEGIDNTNDDDVDDDISIHFNTFESNTVGIEVDESSSAEDFTGTINAQFNDFVDNDNAGLNVVAFDSGNAKVDANYSWWDNRDYSRIVGPYTPQNVESQPPIPWRVYSYTRLHTGGHL